MHALTSTLLAIALAAQGCSGYADSTARPHQSSPDSDAAAKPEPPAEPEPIPEAGPAPTPAPEPTPEPEPAPPIEPDRDAGMNPKSPTTPDAAREPSEVDASEAREDAAVNDTNLRLASSPMFPTYLTDENDRPLYMFAGDVAGAPETACLDTCAADWPPFDIAVPRLDAAIDAAQVGRFHREDGAWQTTYRGHPLYYRATEAGQRSVTGDGVDRRWFVARDYLLFLGVARTFAPASAAPTHGEFLTDGAGRTLYVCLDDQPATLLTEAITSCDEQCLVERPPFERMTERGRALPSLLAYAELALVSHTDGTARLMYRGWPLYYFSGDTTPGATEGHNERAWRAIDPYGFAQPARAPESDEP